MTKERAIEVMQQLALYEIDQENAPPSNIEIGTAIRSYGMAECWDAFTDAIERIELVDENEEE